MCAKFQCHSRGIHHSTHGRNHTIQPYHLAPANTHCYRGEHPAPVFGPVRHSRLTQRTQPAGALTPLEMALRCEVATWAQAMSRATLPYPPHVRRNMVRHLIGYSMYQSVEGNALAEAVAAVTKKTKDLKRRERRAAKQALARGVQGVSRPRTAPAPARLTDDELWAAVTRAVADTAAAHAARQPQCGAACALCAVHARTVAALAGLPALPALPLSPMGPVQVAQVSCAPKIKRARHVAAQHDVARFAGGFDPDFLALLESPAFSVASPATAELPALPWPQVPGWPVQRCGGPGGMVTLSDGWPGGMGCDGADVEKMSVSDLFF